MEWWENVMYLLLYSYVALGFGYYLKMGFTTYRNAEIPEVQFIGIMEKIPSEIDYLFTETEILQIEELV